MVMACAARSVVLDDLRVMMRMYGAALTGRLLYVLHRASGHTVVWRTSRSDSPLWADDIVCESCARILWCRTDDPWRSLVSDRAASPDEDRDGTEGNRARQGGSLFEALDRVLGLAERLPSEASSARIRRSACELIEADSTADRHNRFRELVNAIDALRAGDALRRTGPEDARSAVIAQLLTALRHEVAPILLDRRHQRSADTRQPRSSVSG
jgi:hypothetical protein